jgi:hypothetical protein
MIDEITVRHRRPAVVTDEKDRSAAAIPIIAMEGSMETADPPPVPISQANPRLRRPAPRLYLLQ